MIQSFKGKKTCFVGFSPRLNPENTKHTRSLHNTTEHLIFRFYIGCPKWQQQNLCFEKQHIVASTQWYYVIPGMLLVLCLSSDICSRIRKIFLNVCLFHPFFWCESLLRSLHCKFPILPTRPNCHLKV